MHVDLARLRSHVEALARTPRPLMSDALELARQYVTGHLEDAGWIVRRHEFESLVDGSIPIQGINLVATRDDQPASGSTRFCVGAHLDSRPDTPGADDNASAVAALLEIARVIPALWESDSALALELLVFDLEEVGMLGGAEHARLSKLRPVQLAGMVSLEMLGYCDHRRNTQQLPAPLKGLYPDTGDFIAVVGNQNSATLIERFVAGMTSVDGLPVQHLAVPRNGADLQASRLSDHSPFWDAGYPALMITDTSFLRNPHYHLASDTPDTLDYDFLHRVAEGCLQAVRNVLEKGLC